MTADRPDNARGARAGQLALFDAPVCVALDDRVWRFCVDCGSDTIAIGEYYMVDDRVWPLAAERGMLCVGCLEERLGRTLAPADFTDCPLNKEGGHSPRLNSRLNGRACVRAQELGAAM